MTTTMPEFIPNNEFIRDIYHNDLFFQFNISINDFYVKITKQFENWEARFLIKDILSLPMWKSLVNEIKLFNFLSNQIERKQFDANLDCSPIIIFNMNSGIEGVTIDFTLKLSYIILDIPNKLENLPNYIKKLESRIDDKIKIMMLYKNQSYQNEKLAEENKRLEQEVQNLTLGAKLDIELLRFKDFTYTNNDKKVIKTGANGWIGIRCNRILRNYGRYHYKVKIEETDLNGYIMIGFAQNSIGGTGRVSGFYSVSYSSMFYLNNGQIYENASVKKTIPNFTPVHKGDIFEVVIDCEKKSIHLFTQGNEIGFSPITFDIENITPCVDLYTKGDSISLL